jgi:hypothetical protein
MTNDVFSLHDETGSITSDLTGWTAYDAFFETLESRKINGWIVSNVETDVHGCALWAYVTPRYGRGWFFEGSIALRRQCDDRRGRGTTDKTVITKMSDIHGFNFDDLEHRATE